MNAPQDLIRFARTLSWRLLLVVTLAVLVTGGIYAVAVSPVGTSMASSARRPPGRAPDVTIQVTAPLATDAAQPTEATDATAAASVSAAASTTTEDSATGQPQTTQPQAPPAGAGGGRGPSLSRGLPELGMHAAVVAVLVLILNGAHSLWLMIRRRRGGNRAPIFRHAAVR